MPGAPSWSASCPPTQTVPPTSSATTTAAPRITAVKSRRLEGAGDCGMSESLGSRPVGVSLKGVSKTVSSCPAFSWPRQCSKTPAAGSENQIRSDARGTGQRPGSLRPACSKPSPCFCAKRAQIHQGRHMLGHQTELRVSGSISTPGDGSVCRTKAPPKDLLSVNRRLGPI